MTKLVGQIVRVKSGHRMKGRSGKVVAYVQKNVKDGKRRPLLVEFASFGGSTSVFFAPDELHVTEG